MKLKTLKDIEYCANENPILFASNEVVKDEIRKEAIKWIKEIYCFKQSEVDKEVDDFMGRKTIYSKEAKQGMINFIKYFFNITEEDLK